MSTENDPGAWQVVAGVIASIITFLFGWMVHKTDQANKIANAVSGRLGEFYMKREEVRGDIKEARQELRQDLRGAVEPIHQRLNKIERNLESIVAHIIKSDK